MILVNLDLDSWELRAFQNTWSMLRVLSMRVILADVPEVCCPDIYVYIYINPESVPAVTPRIPLTLSPTLILRWR